MRGFGVALALLMVLGTPALASPVDQPDKWILWSEDGPEYPVPLPGDVDTIRVGTTASDLHIEFTTYPTAAPSVLVASEVMFVADQAQRTSVRFAWDTEPRLWLDGEETKGGWAVSDASDAAGWHLQVRWASLGIFPGGSFALRDLEATTWAMPWLCSPCDPATGPDLEFTADAAGRLSVSVATLDPGATVEGPDFGGGTSVAVDERGAPLLAYYIYDGERGTERGIYLARISEGTSSGPVDATGASFAAERIGDTKVSRDYGGRDDQMRTQVAHDGKDAFVLFTDDPAVDNDEDGPGHPGTPDSVYVLARTDGAWKREDPTPNGRSDVGPEDVADLAARDGKVVAAVPVGNDVWVVERMGPGAWREVTRLAGASNAKIALDSQGGVHAAYVVYDSPDGSWRKGTLYYASSQDGFKATHVGDNIDSGWETPETDGSFAIAVGPQDQVAILWDDGRAERDLLLLVAVLDSGAWAYDVAPLVPGHGNPQYTMRLGYTAKGHLVAASGYGGTDTLAVRGPNGGWVTTDLDRYDVWDMAVSASGNVYFGYTQPHGGTTVALTVYAVSPLLKGTRLAGAEGGTQAEASEAHGDSAQAIGADASAPRLAPAAPIAAVVALLAVAAVLSRRAVR